MWTVTAHSLKFLAFFHVQIQNSRAIRLISKYSPLTVTQRYCNTDPIDHSQVIISVVLLESLRTIVYHQFYSNLGS